MTKASQKDRRLVREIQEAHAVSIKTAKRGLLTAKRQNHDESGPSALKLMRQMNWQLHKIGVDVTKAVRRTARKAQGQEQEHAEAA